MRVRTVIALISILCVFAVNGLYAADSNVVIKGSTTVLPIGQKSAELFMKSHPDVNMSVSGGGSGNGIKAIVDGTCDIAMASRFVKAKELKLACQKGIHLVPHRVAIDCIVPVVHPSNPLNDIDLDTLKEIYTGKMTNWKSLGGLDKPIVVISRDTSSGTYEVWHTMVLKKERVMPRALMQASNGAVAQAVAGNPYAIGYVGIGYLNPHLKGLKVGGVVASPATALNGTYAVSRGLFMFTDGWPKGAAMSYLNYLVSPEGQKMVEAEGFVPLY